MDHSIKKLVAVFVAVVAVAAIAASSAAAEEAKFTSGSDWTVLSAEAKTNQVINFGGGEEMRCESVSFDEATMSTSQTAITATPTLGVTEPDESNAETAAKSKCTVSGLAATVHTQGCDYNLSAGGETSGSIHIENTTETTCEIKVTDYLLGKFRPCIVIHDQTPTTPTFDYVNETYTVGGKSVWRILLKSTMQGLTYTKVGSCGSTEGNNVTYTGETVVKGTDTAGNAVNVTWDSGNAEHTEARFTSGSTATTLTSTAIGSQVFAATTELTVSCASIALDNATMGTKQASISVEPTYGKTVKSEGFTEAETNETECTMTSGALTFKSMVHTNGCTYKLTAGGKTEGSVDIECPAGKEIQTTIDFLGKFRPCLDIPAQTPETPTAAYANGTYVSGGKNIWDIGVKLDFEGVKYKKTGACGEGEFKNGIFAGEFTMKGADSKGNALDVTWDAET